jgi:hypothetical protein
MTRIVLALVAAFLPLSPALAVIAEPAGIAPGIRASADEEPAFMLSADGAQIFQCKARLNAPETYAWLFTAPDVTLYDGPRSVARMASPNLWESTDDRSSVAGIVRGTQAAGTDNLPWLLMRASPIGDTGIFSGVTSIQRVNTTGGVAPANGCDADHAGAEVRVPFRAEYYFYKRRTG